MPMAHWGRHGVGSKGATVCQQCQKIIISRDDLVHVQIGSSDHRTLCADCARRLAGIDNSAGVASAGAIKP